MGRLPDIRLRDLPVLSKEGNKPVCCCLLVGHGDKGPQILDVFVSNILDVVFEILGIGDHNGAVKVVLSIFRLLMLIEDAGVEDGTESAINQPLDVSVRELGRVALRLRGDGIHPALIEPARGEGR